jgi:hypothetical protein
VRRADFTAARCERSGRCVEPAAADLPRKEPPPPAAPVGKAPIGKFPVGKAPIGKFPQPVAARG